MAKFVYVFVGGAPKPGQEDEVMKAWGDWIAELSSKGSYKSGFPFGMRRKEIASDNSVSDSHSQNSGYAVVEASSMDEAVEWAKTGPNQKYGGSTEVFEVMEMPGM
jgi:hypothetical protein